jgi:hypothetical protein
MFSKDAANIYRVDELAGIPWLVVGSKNLCGIAVILQQAAESLVTAYAGSWPVVADFPGREEKDVPLALVVSLRVKMINKIGQLATQRGFAKEHQFR